MDGLVDPRRVIGLRPFTRRSRRFTPVIEIDGSRHSSCGNEAPQPIAEAHKWRQGSRSPAALIEISRRSLQGESFVPVAQALEITQPRVHGQVQGFAVALVTNSGQSTWFVGSLVPMVYLICAITLYLLPLQGW
jgi:hypothetical protein